MSPGDLSSPSVNFSCSSEIIRQLLSTFRADDRPAVNIPCGRDTLRQLPSTFHAGRGPSVNFRQISKLPVDLRSNYVNFSGSLVAFHQYFVGPQTSRQIPSTFCAVERPSVNFCQLSMPLSHLLSTSIKFPCTWETFHQLPSTFLQPVDLSNSVNFFCSRQTFCQFSCRWETFHQLRQLSVWLGDLLSTFRATDRSSINLRQLSVPSEDLPSISVNFPSSGRTSVRFRNFFV